MNGVILRRTLQDSRYVILAWCLGLAFWVLLLASVFPAIEGSPEFNQILEAYPPVVRALFMSDLVEIITPDGFTWMEFGTWIPMFFGIQVVVDGLAALAGEERRGTLDLVLSTPIPRWRVVMEKFTAICIEVTVVILASYCGFVAATHLVSGYTLDLNNTAWMLFTMWLVLLVMLALTMTVSVLARRRGTAAGIMVGLILGSYILNAIGQLNQVLDKLRPLSFFYYYHGQEAMMGKLEFWGPAVHALMIIALTGITVVAFNKRDLAV